ncbi:MAG TPA: OmpH family outer membrane protein [Pyrinomonadaceae bacterium]
MRINRLIVACAMLATITILPVYAQQRPAAAAAAPVSSGPMPESKIAVIFTDAFLDQKQGIGRINTIAANLEREFNPRQTELQGLQQRIKTATEEINKLQSGGAPIDPKSMQAKIDQLDTMKKELQRKAEDAQAAYTKRQQEVLGPLQEDIGKALEAYAKQRGITVLIDASRVPLIYAADGLDITRAFITEYNSKNPATASAR